VNTKHTTDGSYGDKGVKAICQVVTKLPLTSLVLQCTFKSSIFFFIFIFLHLAAKFTDEGMEDVLSLVSGTTTLENVEIPYGMI
jgi:hypothetical protein